MGQNSSQVAPSQTFGSTQAVQLSSAPMEPPPKPSSKRERVSNGDEEVAKRVKRAKNGAQDSSKERKARRAVPQHRRGTAIRPLDSSEVEISQDAVALIGDTIAVDPPGKSNNNAQSQDGIVVNGTSKSSPKKRKRDKTVDQPSNVEEEVEASEIEVRQRTRSVEPEDPAVEGQAAPGAVDVEAEDVIAVSPVAESRHKRTDEKERREEKERKRRRAAREAESPDKLAAETTLPVSVHSDGLPVNETGQPGPKRKKKKKKKQKPDSPNDEASAKEPRKSRKARRVHGVSSESPSAIRPSTPSEGEDYVIDPHYDPNEEESEHDDEYDATVRPGYVEPTEQVQGWLDSQLDVKDDDKEIKPKKKRRKSKKEVNEDWAESSETKVSNPALNTGAMAEETDYGPTAMRRFQTAERGTVSGKWSPAELELAEKVFHDFCRNNKISDAELRQKTTDWAKLGALKVQWYEAFPGRRMDVIRKHMQRRFSPFQKGHWTEEETQRLKDAYAKYPDQWSKIAKEVERDLQACRDRWNNQLVYEDSMDRGAWSIAEEAKLVKIVEEAITLIQHSTEDAEVRNDRLKAESTIHWDEIAKKMDGKRTKKRCFEKWRLLKRRGVRDNPLNKPNSDAEVEEKKPSSKIQTVERQYARMKPGDIYDALSELLAAVEKMPYTDYHDESTFWAVVATKRPKDSSFKTTSLIRRAYLGAMETYPSKRLRKAETYPKKIGAVMKKMRKLAKKGRVDLEEKGYSLYLPPARKMTPKKTKTPEISERKTPGTKSPKKVFALSADLVVDSDDDVKPYVPETQEEPESEAEEDPEHEEEGDVEEDTQYEEEEQEEGDVEEGTGKEEEEEIDAKPTIAAAEDTQSLRSETPYLSPKEFAKRCKKAGRKQHKAYLKGYGR